MVFKLNLQTVDIPIDMTHAVTVNGDKICLLGESGGAAFMKAIPTFQKNSRV